MQNSFINTADNIGAGLFFLAIGIYVLMLMILMLLKKGGIEEFAREHNKKKMRGECKDNYLRDLWIMLAFITGACMSDMYLTATGALLLMLLMLRMEKYLRHIHQVMLSEKGNG